LGSHWRLRTTRGARPPSGPPARQHYRSRPGPPLCQSQGAARQNRSLDAAVLSDDGRTFQPATAVAPTGWQTRLAEPALHRRQLIDSRLVEANRAEHYQDKGCTRQSKQLLRLLEKQIAACDPAIAELIAADETLKTKAARLDAIPGVGPITAATVLAEMPELGQLSHSAAAAWAGVAPYNSDSGTVQGGRHIAGGRRPLRGALYMAALSAIRYDTILKSFYLHLRAAGKKPKVALVACLRKLVILMNRLLKNDKFQLAN